MVEVAMAIGLMAFCLVTLTGLLPAGLTSQQSALGQTKAILALGAVSTCIRGMTRNSGNNCRFMLPSTNPLEFNFTPGAKAFSASCGYTEAGSFSAASDSAQVRESSGRIYMKFNPPETADETGSIYVTAAWPGTAVYDGNAWTRHLGYVETVVYFNLPQ